MTEAGMFFEKTGPVWETLRALEQSLEEAGIDYVVIGGLALNAHDYPRQTIDVDVVLTREGYEEFKRRLGGSRYPRASTGGRRNQYVNPDTEVTIDVLVAGGVAGNRRKNSTVLFPDPAESERHGDIRTVSLARLIELKLVTWRYKDWGDVVELIRRHKLAEDFADQLDPVVRTAYGECYDQARDEIYEGPQLD